MPTYKGIQQINEYDTLQGFTYSGNFPVTKGTFVRLIGSGFRSNAVNTLGDNMGLAVGNTLSRRWVGLSQVTASNSSGDAVLGFLQYDGRETDENGNPLRFNSQSVAEREVFTSGQACPIVRRGLVYYSGINGAGANAGAITPGATAFLGIDGGMNTSGTQTAVDNPRCTKVGQFLSARDDAGFALVYVDIRGGL